MLRKLIKYDLKIFQKIMIPLWGVMIILGLIRGIQDQLDHASFIKEIVLIFCFIFIVNLIIIIQRFYKSMYGQEGYLTHTLPITANKLILSKVISATIISFTTAFLFYLENGILMYLQSKLYHGTYSINDIMITKVQDFANRKVLQAIIFMIIYGIFWLIRLIYEAYTAITIGQLSKENKLPTMIITGAVIFLGSYEIEMYLLRYTTGNHFYQWPCLIMYLIEIIICHIITIYLTRKKLELI